MERRSKRQDLIEEIQEALGAEKSSWQNILERKFEEDQYKAIKLTDWDVDNLRVTERLSKKHDIGTRDVIYRIDDPELTGETYGDIEDSQTFYLVVTDGVQATYHSFNE